MTFFISSTAGLFFLLYLPRSVETTTSSICCASDFILIIIGLRVIVVTLTVCGS